MFDAVLELAHSTEVRHELRGRFALGVMAFISKDEEIK